MANAITQATGGDSISTDYGPVQAMIPKSLSAAACESCRVITPCLRRIQLTPRFVLRWFAKPQVLSASDDECNESQDKHLLSQRALNPKF